MEEEAARRKREKYVTRAGMEERKEGGLTAPKRVRGAPKTQSEWRSCGDYRDDISPSNERPGPTECCHRK
ncbi:hypothetical protein TNCV_3775221, partial [Trichonephila clavipes]